MVLVALLQQSACMGLFLTLRKLEDQTMHAWIRDIQRAAAWLWALGRVTVTDEDLVLVLTMEFPASYQTLIIALDTMAETELTPSIVTARLVNKESRQSSLVTKTKDLSQTALVAHTCVPWPTSRSPATPATSAASMLPAVQPRC
jgi:hypothetical protein